MGKPPAFQFYPTDFLGDKNVEAMTAEEVGVYWLLCCVSWQENPIGTLPDDDQKLAKWARLSKRKWNGVRETILNCFEKKEGRFYQRRLRREYLKQQKLRHERQKAGQIGGLAKGKQTRSKPLAKVVAKGKQNEALQSPSSIPIYIRKKSIKKKENYQQEFKSFWDNYPRKRAKEAALKAFVRLIQERVDPQKIIAAAKHYAEYCIEDKVEEQFIKHPATFLNSGDYKSFQEKPQPKRVEIIDARPRNG